MLSKDEYLALINSAYAFRMAGDTDGVMGLMAPNANFRIASAAETVHGVPLGSEMEPRPKIAALIAAFQFHNLERVEAVVDGLKAAVLWRVVVSHGGGAPVETELFDLWTLNEAGKVQSVVQFTDTALAERLVKPMADYVSKHLLNTD